MKKWLIRCLTVLAMVCLIPGIVLNVKAADSIYTYCFVCMQQRNYEILGYTKVDSTKHRIHIKCSVCGRKNSIVYGVARASVNPLQNRVIYSTLYQ